MVVFRDIVQGKHILIIYDNKSAVAYINKQGGLGPRDCFPWPEPYCYGATVMEFGFIVGT